MQHFISLTYLLINTAVDELSQAQQLKKIGTNPVAETHFLTAWLTNSLKNKRFDKELVPLLKSWQQQSRSSGKNCTLINDFKAFKQAYNNIADTQCQPLAINKNQLLKLLSMLNEKNWLTHTESLISKKSSFRSGGQHSLLICSEQFEINFCDGILDNPISLYIRGDVKLVVKLALECGLLIYKKTDYKSLVKYHGEYLIYPYNSAQLLPELN